MIEEEIEKVRFSEDEIAEARKMAEGVLSVPSEDASNFLLNNAKSILGSTYCKKSYFGYLAYVPVAYKKYLAELARRKEFEAKRKAERESQYVGEIGEKISFRASDVSLLTSWENHYGYTYLYKFLDENGNVYIWFASKCIDKAGSAMVKGTVKDHSERSGVKQTILTRCKID